MKLMSGYEHDKPVGEIYLTKEIVDILLQGGTFILGASIRTTETGVKELAGLSLSVEPAQPAEPKAKLDKHCKACGTTQSAPWWKCCPEHTNDQDANDVVCADCMRKNHPASFGAE